MIFQSWNEIPEISKNVHDSVFLDILSEHGFDSIKLIVPLMSRYTKGRRWTDDELQQCINAWHEQKSITFIAGCLNRNPQDIIYKLLSYCKSNGIEFTQKLRSETSLNWNNKVKACAEALFEKGLPAWKVAVTFQVDFEFVEKELFIKRQGYGHDKKNPFSINTDHKQLVNKSILEDAPCRIIRAFEPFAGEGKMTQLLLGIPTIKEVVCVEADPSTFARLTNSVDDNRVKFINHDSIEILVDSSEGIFELIDLDPFITCHEHIDYVWDHLADDSLLFITFGGEYRRSFIKTNRTSISNRYGFKDFEIGNSEYLEVVPYYFIGYIAMKAMENGFKFDILRSVRYANNCRFWLHTTRDDDHHLWFNRNVDYKKEGFFFKNINIPRFREVRKELDMLPMKGIFHE